MRITSYESDKAFANLQPHRTTHKENGPWQLRIGTRSQPEIVKNWDVKYVRLNIEQTEKDTNFTLIKVVYLKGGLKIPSLLAGVKMHRARVFRRRNGAIDVRIKARYGRTHPHPFPTGRYVGNCMYDVAGGFAVFTFQAVDLKKEPEPSTPKTIITPGDEGFNESLRDAKAAFQRAYGMDGGTTDSGGLRNG